MRVTLSVKTDVPNLDSPSIENSKKHKKRKSKRKKYERSMKKLEKRTQSCELPKSLVSNNLAKVLEDSPHQGSKPEESLAHVDVPPLNLNQMATNKLETGVNDTASDIKSSENSEFEN